MDRDKFTSIALIVQAEETLSDIDKDHLSEDSRRDIDQTESKLRFSKKVEMARYGMDWSRIRDLFLAGQYDVLEDNYSEDWDAEDLMEREV